MRLPRPLLIILALGLLLFQTRGLYHPLLVLTLPILLALFFWPCQKETPDSFLVKSWACLGSFFALHGIFNPKLIIITDPIYLWPVAAGYLVLFFVPILLIFPYASKTICEKKISKLFWLSLFSALVIFSCSILACHEPWIDVWEMGTLASKALLNGTNPYSLEYPQSKYPPLPYKTFFGYPPLLAIYYSPWLYLLGDIRFGWVACHLVTAYLLRETVRHTKASPALQVLIPVSYFAFPTLAFVVAQSWVDPLPVMLATAMAFTFLRKKPYLVALFAALFLCTKQSNVLAAPILLFLCYRAASERSPKALAVSILIGVGTVVAINLPFYLSNPGGFVAYVLWMTQKSELTGGEKFQLFDRLDALSLNAFLIRQKLGKIPISLPLALSIGSSIFFVWKFRNRPYEHNILLFLALSFSYLVMFIFSSWSFLNYYWFSMLGLWICAAAQPAQDLRYQLIQKVKETKR